MGFLSRLFSKRDKGVDEIVKNGAQVIDVRTTTEFSSGHLPNSVNIPLSQITSQIDELKHSNNYVLVCRSGNRSSEAIKMLKKYGFTNLYNGGSWQSIT